MSFSTPFNPQSGIQVGGYPTMGVPAAAFARLGSDVHNVDPDHRAITIWPQTELAMAQQNMTGSIPTMSMPTTISWTALIPARRR